MVWRGNRRTDCFCAPWSRHRVMRGSTQRDEYQMDQCSQNCRHDCSHSLLDRFPRDNGAAKSIRSHLVLGHCNDRIVSCHRWHFRSPIDSAGSSRRVACLRPDSTHDDWIWAKRQPSVMWSMCRNWLAQWLQLVRMEHSVQRHSMKRQTRRALAIHCLTGPRYRRLLVLMMACTVWFGWLENHRHRWMVAGNISTAPTIHFALQSVAVASLMMGNRLLYWLEVNRLWCSRKSACRLLRAEQLLLRAECMPNCHQLAQHCNELKWMAVYSLDNQSPCLAHSDSEYSLCLALTTLASMMSLLTRAISYLSDHLKWHPVWRERTIQEIIERDQLFGAIRFYREKEKKRKTEIKSENLWYLPWSVGSFQQIWFCSSKFDIRLCRRCNPFDANNRMHQSKLPFLKNTEFFS